MILLDLEETRVEREERVAREERVIRVEREEREEREERVAREAREAREERVVVADRQDRIQLRAQVPPPSTAPGIDQVIDCSCD